MTENPYRLTRDVRGIGFKTADGRVADLHIHFRQPQRLVRIGSSNCPKHSAASSSCQDAGLPGASFVDDPLQKLVNDYKRCAATAADLHVVACVGLMLKKVTMLVPVNDRL